jgi:hypothetical protein
LFGLCRRRRFGKNHKLAGREVNRHCVSAPGGADVPFSGMSVLMGFRPARAYEKRSY